MHPSKGVSEGKAGRRYAGVCEGQADADFRRGHSVGMEYYTITSRISALQGKISMAQARQKKVPEKSAEFYKLDGDIRVSHAEIRSLSVQQGQVEQRADSLMSEFPTDGF